MLNVKQIRNEYGLGQHELAMLLGISRGLLSMVECKQRQLPNSALLKLVVVQNLRQNKQKPIRDTVEEQKQTVKALRKLLKACIVKERRAKLALRRLQKHHEAKQTTSCCREADLSHAHRLPTPHKHTKLNVAELCRLEIKAEALEAERKIIEEKVQKALKNTKS